MGDGHLPGHRLAGSWLRSFQGLMGSRPHKPSFVVVEIGQSGCHILAKWFDACPRIAFQADILSQSVRFPLTSVFQRIRQSDRPLYGFNLTVEQMRQAQRLADPNQFLKDLNRGGCRVIFLNRRDMLRHAIALLKTHSTSCRFDDNAPQRQNRVTVDTSELLACLKYLDNQRLEAHAILHGVPHLLLMYEDDLVDPNCHAETAQRMAEFLAMPTLKPVGGGIKLVHHRLSDLVVNYDEACKALAQSDYAYLLTPNRHVLTV